MPILVPILHKNGYFYFLKDIAELLRDCCGVDSRREHHQDTRKRSVQNSVAGVFFYAKTTTRSAQNTRVR